MPAWLPHFAQIVDKGVVDCRKELRLECDSSLVVSAEVVAAVVVECVGRTDLGGRGICTMGFLDARIGSGSERGFGDECVICCQNDLGEMAM